MSKSYSNTSSAYGGTSMRKRSPSKALSDHSSVEWLIGRLSISISDVLPLMYLLYLVFGQYPFDVIRGISPRR